MKSKTTFIVATLGVAALLAGCSSKSPTAPKQPTPGTFSVTLTSDTASAGVGENVLVVAQVSSGSANAPDGTAVTFLVSGGVFPVGVDTQGNIVTATSVVRTTSAGRATVNVTATVPGQVLVEARVAGGTAQKAIAFSTATGPTPTPAPGGLTIGDISPNQGGPEGGDRVVITGTGFVQPLSVKFVVAGQPFAADIDFIAPDGKSMTVTTPRVTSTPPATQDQKADVMVTAGAFSVIRTQGFTFLAEVLTPQINVITPNAGPFEGGTRVVISGIGFQSPVQVLFGTRQAQVTSSNYTDVECIAPSITPEGPNAFTSVSVTVTNITNGKVSNGMDYRYGETMYISGIEPPVGPQDAATTVTIFGQGFVSPVSITVTGVTGVTTWDVTSVAGTEVIARTRPLPDTAYTCDNVPATVKVTNLGSNTSATSPSGAFTYQAVRPLITSVQIDGGGNTVPQYLAGTCNTPWTSHTVTVHGSGFQQVGGISAMTVAIGDLPDIPATFVDSNTLTLTLPDLTQIAVNQVKCNDGGGDGMRNIATPVGVTVKNQRSTCANSLQGAIVINPCDTTCRIAPTITNISPSQGTITGGTGVTITGTGFLAGATVSFGGAVVSSLGSGSSITCTTPAGAEAGAVDVTVTNPPPNNSSVTRASGFTYTATLAVTISGTGTVTSNPAGISCSTGTCSFLFNQSPIGLTASTSGTFSGWSVDCSGTGASTSVVLDAATKNCTATFTP